MHERCLKEYTRKWLRVVPLEKSTNNWRQKWKANLLIFYYKPLLNASP